MNAVQLRGIRSPQPDRHASPNVSALGAVTRVIEHLGHEGGERVGHGHPVKTLLVGVEREAIARQRGGDHGEGIAGIAAKTGRVCEHGEQFVEFPDRAGPPMQ